MKMHVTYQPAGWLRELTRVKPPQWDWGRAIRAAASVSVPIALGTAFDQFMPGLLIALGALTIALGDGDGSYRSRFRQMAISSLIGVLGFFAGYLHVLPYPAVIAIMAALAFVAGIVNSYGAAYSIGTMQALLYAAVAIGLPDVAPYWQMAALVLVGVGFYAAMMGLEALFYRERPERAMLAGLVSALAHLARVRADVSDGEAESDALAAARRGVTDRSRALYEEVIANRRGGRTHETLAHADFLDSADTLFGALLSEGDAATLDAAARWLNTLAAAVERRGTVPPPPDAGPHGIEAGQPVADALAAFAAAAASDAVVHRDRQRDLPRPRFPHGELSLPHLAVGRVVLQRSAALSLCIAIAYSARYVIHADHWYWVPLTVTMVMKPDLGSVFVRAVLRAAGTSIGVVIGAALLVLLPKGPVLIAALAVIAACLPLAKSLSYGAQTLALTPVVLILLDLISPTPGTVDYGGQRLVDTLLGGLIALVFGYFIWPRGLVRDLAPQFDAALGATSDYLVAAMTQGGDRSGTIAAERGAYASLSDLRAVLGRAMAEPPPAGREAAAWFPLVAAAERICDRITAGAPQAGSGAWPSGDEVARVAASIKAVVPGGVAGTAPLPAQDATRPDAIRDPVLRGIAVEVDQLAQRVEGAMSART